MLVGIAPNSPLDEREGSGWLLPHSNDRVSLVLNGFLHPFPGREKRVHGVASGVISYQRFQRI